MYQKTIKKELKISGVGVHSGKIVNITIKPAEPNTGIIFKRIDLGSDDSSISIKATWSNVVDTKLSTVIANTKNARVATIEHLMAAFAGLRISNAIIEIDNLEVPILDGSSKIFVKQLLKAKVIEQLGAYRKTLRILRPLSIQTQDIQIEVIPSNRFKVDFLIDFPNTPIKQQKYKFDSKYNDFVKNIAFCRTFAKLEDIEKLQAMGLALGGNLHNAIVVSKDGILNKEGTRCHDEFVRHKILDCFGDFYLSEYEIAGAFKCSKSGHTANNLILREIFSNSQNYAIDTLEDKRFLSVSFQQQIAY